MVTSTLFFMASNSIVIFFVLESDTRNSIYFKTFTPLADFLFDISVTAETIEKKCKCGLSV